MNMKKIFLTAALAVFAPFFASAQQPAASHDGGISAKMLAQISEAYEGNPYDKAISNALAGTSIAKLAINADNAAMIAYEGYLQYKKGNFSDLTLNAQAVVPLE